MRYCREWWLYVTLHVPVCIAILICYPVEQCNAETGISWWNDAFTKSLSTVKSNRLIYHNIPVNLLKLLGLLWPQNCSNKEKKKKLFSRNNDFPEITILR